MSKVEIDFETLKYNLYEILNVKSDYDESKIRKAFIKLIKTFHPDKNSKLEEDIYYHLILSNQILLNKEIRKKYDEFLKGKIETFTELKDQFKKQPKPTGQMNINSFNQQVNKLNEQHGYNENKIILPTLDKFNSLKINRDNEITIEKEKINNIEEFNNKFTDYKKSGKFKNQIIEYNKNTELSTHDNSSYVGLNQIDKLYMEGSVISSNYASLDKAFALETLPTNVDKLTIDEYKHYSRKLNINV
jgi:DnaJ-class molecular chaperone